MPTTMVQRKSFVCNVCSKYERRKHTHTRTHSATAAQILVLAFLCQRFCQPPCKLKLWRFVCIYLIIFESVRAFLCAEYAYCAEPPAFWYHSVCICFECTNNPFSLTIFTREALVSLYRIWVTTCFLDLFSESFRILLDFCQTYAQFSSFSIILTPDSLHSNAQNQLCICLFVSIDRTLRS